MLRLSHASTIPARKRREQITEEVAFQASTIDNNNMNQHATHGKRSTYIYGCRCKACTRANTEYSKALKSKLAKLKIPNELHGLQGTYGNWKCRCEKCKAARRLYKKERAQIMKSRSLFEEYDDGYSIASHILAELVISSSTHPPGLTSAEIAALITNESNGYLVSNWLSSLKKHQLVTNEQVTLSTPMLWRVTPLGISFLRDRPPLTNKYH